MANDGQATTTESPEEAPLNSVCTCKALQESLRSDLRRLRELDEAALAKVLVAFFNFRSELENSVCSCKQVAEERQETEVCSSDELSWSAAQFVDAIKSDHPGVNWGRIAAALDFEGFQIFDRNAFVSLMEIFQFSTLGGFPLEAVLGMVWRNEKAQLDFLQHAVAVPPRLFAFRVDQLVFPVSVLEARKSSSGTEDHSWVSLDLLETLYMLAKGRHEPEVRKILDHLVKHCKEFLLVALDRMGVPECDIFQEAYRNLVEHFLRQSLCSSESDPEEVCTTVKNMVLECAVRQQQKSPSLPDGPASDCLLTGRMGSQSNHTASLEASTSDSPSQPDSANSSMGSCSLVHCVSHGSSVAELSDQWFGATSTTGSDSSRSGALVAIEAGAVQPGNSKLEPQGVGENQDSGESDVTDVVQLDSNPLCLERLGGVDGELQLHDHGLLAAHRRDEQSLECEIPELPAGTLADAGCSRYLPAAHQPVYCVSRTPYLGRGCSRPESGVRRKASFSPLSAGLVASHDTAVNAHSQRKEVLFDGGLYPTFGLSTVNKTLREARPPHCLHPTPDVQNLIYSVTTDIRDFQSLGAKICSSIQEDDLILLADALLCRHVVRSELSHRNCLNLINAVDSQKLRECILEVTYHYIDVFLHSKRLKTDIVDQNSLKHLGVWLGQITLARCRPIRLKDLDLKAVLDESWREGSLHVVLPFVRSVLMAAQGSLVFTSDNPWIKALLVSLSEVHANGPVIVRSEVEKIFEHFDSNVLNYQRSTSSCLHSTMPGKSRATGTSCGSFYRNQPWLVYQPASVQSRQSGIEQNSSKLNRNISKNYQLTSNGRNKQNGCITAPILDRRLQGAMASPSQLGWSHRASSDGAWTEVPANVMLDRSDMAWHHPDAISGFCPEKWVHNSLDQRVRRNSISVPGLYGSNRQRDLGNRVHLGVRDSAQSAARLGGRHVWRSWCVADTRDSGMGWIYDSEQREVENGSSDDLLDPRSSDIREHFVEGNRNVCIRQSNNCGRQVALRDESRLKETSSGYESDDQWEDGCTEKVRQEYCDTSGTADCEEGRQPSSQAPKGIDSRELCSKGRSGDKLRADNISYHAPLVQDYSGSPWHRCTHSKGWKHGSVQKTKAHHCRVAGSTVGPAPPPPPTLSTQSGSRSAPVLHSGRRRSARVRHRRAGQNGHGSAGRHLVNGWKPCFPNGTEICWDGRCEFDGAETWMRTLDDGSNPRASDSVQLNTLQRVLGPGVVYRLNSSNSSPRSHDSSEIHHSNHGSGDWAQQHSWGVQDFECGACGLGAARWGVDDEQGKVGKPPQRGCSKGKQSRRHNGKDVYRREGAPEKRSSQYGGKEEVVKHKIDDKVVEKRRHKKRHRNKKPTGGGRVHHQRTPKHDRMLKSGEFERLH